MAIVFLMLVRGKSMKGEEPCISILANFPGNDELGSDSCAATDEPVAADFGFRVCMITLLSGKTENIITMQLLCMPSYAL